MASEMKFTINGDASSAIAVLNQFSSVVKGTTDQVTGHFGGIAHALESVMAPVTALLSALGGGALFHEAIAGAKDFNKELAGLQRIMGGTTKDAAATAWAVKSVFGDVDTYQSAAAKLIKTLNKNEDAITSMGVRTRTASGHFRDMNTLLPEVVNALNQYSAGADRDAMAQQIFGRGFQDMLKFAKLTPEAFEEARRSQEAYGIGLESQKNKTVAYRHAMEDVDKGMEALKVRVAAEVMPALTQLAHWLSENGPAAVNAIAGALRTMGSVLSNTGAQLAILGFTLATIGPGLVTLAVGLGSFIANLPIAALAIDAFRLQMKLAAMEGVTGIAAVTGSIQAMTASLLTNPLFWLAAGVIALAAAVSYYSGEHKRAMDAIKENSDKAADATRDFAQSTKRVKDAQDDLKGAKEGTEDHTRATLRLELATKDMLAHHKDVAANLVDEAGKQRTLAEAIEVTTQKRLADLRAQLAAAEAAAKPLEANIAQKRQWNESAQHSEGEGETREAEGQTYTVVGANDSAIVHNSVVIEQDTKKLELVNATAQGLRDQLRIITEVEKAGKVATNATKKDNSFESDMVKFEQKALAFADKTTLDKEEEVEYRKLALVYAADLLEIEKKLKDHRITPDQARQERARVNSLSSDEAMGIKANFDKKRNDERNRVRTVELASERAHEAALSALEVQHIHDQEALGVIGAAEALRRIDALNEARFQKERAALDAELALENQKPEKVAEINSKIVALEDKHEADMAKIHAREKAEGQTTWDALRGGFGRFANSVKSVGLQLSDIGMDIGKNLSNGIGKAFTDLMKKGASFGAVMKALMKSLKDSTVNALAQMAAQELVKWTTDKAIHAWRVASGAEQRTLQEMQTNAQMVAAAEQEAINAGVVASDTATGLAQQGVAESTMAAKIYAWYSSMGPWAIPAAAATIAGVVMAVKALEGREHGGPVTAGTPYIVGEAGHELFVPSQSGTIIPHHLLGNASQNLSANLSAHSTQVSRLQTQASSYGQAAVSNAQAKPAHTVDLRGAVIAGESVESGRIIGNMVKKHLDSYSRRNA